MDNDLRAQLENARIVALPANDPGNDPANDPGGEPDGPPPPAPPGQGRPRGEIWDGCPVRPLGVNGDFSYYLDRLGQLRAVKKHENQTIMHLFGDRLGQLIRHYPTYAKGAAEPQKHRFDGTRASMDMMAAAAEQGLFNPDGAVRGCGAWLDDDGGLVYHTGRQLITSAGLTEPGVIDGRIYPAYPAIPAPAPVDPRQRAAEDTLALLSTWNWTRPDIDPMVTLGMIGVQMLGGALAWRPAFWFTGDKSSGKSTLHDLIKWLHGDHGLVQSTDPTKSGITARIGHSSLPVALDELEPGDEGSSRERDIITLARVASSGGQWLRGTADQKGASGNVYSTFMFSSILIPGAMQAQDRSRLITLNLIPPPADAPKPVIDPRTQKARGAALKRVLIDRWPTWAERLDLWRVALARHDMAGRNGDNWATTMAMADAMLNAVLPSAEHLDIWARKVAFGARSEVDDIGSNAEDMLLHLLGQPFDVYRRGELWLVAHWLMTAARLPGAPAELIAGSDGGFIDEELREQAARRANEKLSKIGLRVRGTGEAAELFLPNKKIPGLARLFEHSTWSSGVWSQAARRVPGATPAQVSLAGQITRGVYIPFRSISGLLAFPMDRSPAAPSPVDPDEIGDFA